MFKIKIWLLPFNYNEIIISIKIGTFKTMLKKHKIYPSEYNLDVSMIPALHWFEGKIGSYSIRHDISTHMWNVS